jgi:3-methyladenine DNA glycosylase/8-oxoguanine DNA glycosylase
MRKPFVVAERLRERLAAVAGTGFEVAGETLFAAPLPAQLLALGVGGLREIAGLDTKRAERLLAIASVMRDERFAADALRRLEPDEARARLRELPGIGAFCADLILVRASGATDVLPSREPRFLALVAALYGAGLKRAAVRASTTSRFNERCGPPKHASSFRDPRASLARGRKPRVSSPDSAPVPTRAPCRTPSHAG